MQDNQENFDKTSDTASNDEKIVAKAVFVPSKEGGLTKKSDEKTVIIENKTKAAPKKDGAADTKADKSAQDADATMQIPVIEADDGKQKSAKGPKSIADDTDFESTRELPETEAAAPVLDTEDTAQIPVQSFSEEAAITPEEKSALAPQKNKKKAGRTRKWPFFLAASAVCIILCAAVVVAYVMPDILSGDGVLELIGSVSNVVGEPPEYTNVLLVGTDKGGYRTDTIIVASYDNEAETVHMLQIPRDTYVKGNGRKDKKINSAYYSGIDTLKDEIFMSLGIEIHKYLAVELKGFVELIDKIGGVDVEVPINMDYDDPVQDLHIHIKKGLQHLDGHDAEGFVRYRKGNDGSSYPLGDIDRMKAQKQFITNAVAKVASAEGISKIPELISIVKNNIETDISTSDMTSYAAKILSLPGESINFYTAPGIPLYKYGGWYYFVDGKETQNIVMQHFNGDKNKKQYAPVYYDLNPDSPSSSSGASSHYDYSSSDIDDDERYSYYSPDAQSYYDDDYTSAPQLDDEQIQPEDDSEGEASEQHRAKRTSSSDLSENASDTKKTSHQQSQPKPEQSASQNSAESHAKPTVPVISDDAQSTPPAASKPAPPQPTESTPTGADSAPVIDLD